MPGDTLLEKLVTRKESEQMTQEGPILVDEDKLTGELNYGREKWKPWNTGIALDML